jgi:hypothetical protein
MAVLAFEGVFLHIIDLNYLKMSASCPNQISPIAMIEHESDFGHQVKLLLLWDSG